MVNRNRHRPGARDLFRSRPGFYQLSGSVSYSGVEAAVAVVEVVAGGAVAVAGACWRPDCIVQAGGRRCHFERHFVACRSNCDRLRLNDFHLVIPWIQFDAAPAATQQSGPACSSRCWRRVHQSCHDGPDPGHFPQCCYLDVPAAARPNSEPAPAAL